MKWLIIQSDGVHKGQDGWEPNWFLRECYSVQHALKLLSEEADVWGLRHDNFSTTPDFDSYHAIILAENYEMDWVPDLAYRAPFRFHWVIDLHWQPWTNYYRWSEASDIVLHATQQFIETYEKHVLRPKHYWFPNAVDDRYFNLKGAPSDRAHDIVFIGGKGKPREQLIDRMVAEAGMFYGYGITGRSYIRTLQHAKIGFNKSLAGDINYRTFETIACGACLLTERNWNLEKLGFTDGVNCVLYESDDHAVELAKELLSTGRWKEIGRAGAELAKKHTYAERVKLLLSHQRI